jgi:TusA-related sulfurtransferase
MQRPDKTLDIQGIAGKRARALAGETLAPMRPGEVLKLIMTGRDAQDGIAALCREEGYHLLQAVWEGSSYSFFIQR